MAGPHRHSRAPALAAFALCLAWPAVSLAKDGKDSLSGRGLDRSLQQKYGRRGTGFGLGVSVGDPMGLSAKYFITRAHAISGHVAWGILHNGDGLVEIDYHWHTRVIGSSPIVDAHFYIGGGIGVGFWARPSKFDTDGDRPNGGAALLLRAPALGLAYHWTNAPLDTSLEAAWSPYILLPRLRHLDASIKVRYFF